MTPTLKKKSNWHLSVFYRSCGWFLFFSPNLLSGKSLSTKINHVLPCSRQFSKMKILRQTYFKKILMRKNTVKLAMNSVAMSIAHTNKGFCHTCLSPSSAFPPSHSFENEVERMTPQSKMSQSPGLLSHGKRHLTQTNVTKTSQVSQRHKHPWSGLKWASYKTSTPCTWQQLNCGTGYVTGNSRHRKEMDMGKQTLGSSVGNEATWNDKPDKQPHV